MGTLIILRIVHIGAGVFWAGGVLFMNFVVGPALGAAGPEGMRVMQELNRRKYFHKVLGAGAFTIVAGLELLRRDSAGFTPSWFHSPFGIGIATGMVSAIIAFLMGAFLIGPTMKRVSALGAEMASASADARAALAPQVDAARKRLIGLGMIGSMFILVAVLAMATARYL